MFSCIIWITNYPLHLTTALPSQSQDGVLVNGTLNTSTTTQNTTQNNLISSTSNCKGSTILGSKDTSWQRLRDVNGSDERSEEFEFLEQTSSRSLSRNDTSDAEDDFVDGDMADVTCRSNGVIKNAVKVNNQKDALVQTKKTKVD